MSDRDHPDYIDLDYKDGEWVELPIDDLEELSNADLHEYAKRHAVHDLEWALTERVGFLIESTDRLAKQKEIAAQDVFDLNNLVTSLRAIANERTKDVEAWMGAEAKTNELNRKLQQDKNDLVEEVNRRESIEAELRAQLAEVTEELDYLRSRA